MFLRILFMVALVASVPLGTSATAADCVMVGSGNRHHQDPECEDVDSPPVEAPSAKPSPSPSTSAPSPSPSYGPSFTPTISPSALPTVLPSVSPSNKPTVGPTVGPSAKPTPVPSDVPTTAPTVEPTATPSGFPTVTSKCKNVGGVYGEVTNTPTKVSFGYELEVSTDIDTLKNEVMPNLEDQMVEFVLPLVFGEECEQDDSTRRLRTSRRMEVIGVSHHPSDSILEGVPCQNQAEGNTCVVVSGVMDIFTKGDDAAADAAEVRAFLISEMDSGAFDEADDSIVRVSSTDVVASQAATGDSTVTAGGNGGGDSNALRTGLLVAAAGGLMVLLAGLFALRRRRENNDDEDSSMAGMQGTFVAGIEMTDENDLEQNS